MFKNYKLKNVWCWPSSIVFTLLRDHTTSYDNFNNNHNLDLVLTKAHIQLFFIKP